jgi:hypothetical protein
MIAKTAVFIADMTPSANRSEKTIEATSENAMIIGSAKEILRLMDFIVIILLLQHKFTYEKFMKG